MLELDNRRSLGIGKTKRKAEAAASLNYLNNDYLSGGNFLQLGKPVSAPDTKYPPSKKRKSKLKLEKMIARKKEEANAVTELKMEIKSEQGDKGEYYQQTETKFSLEEKCKAGLAFVKMEDASDAVNAGIGLDGTRICGSKVKVEMEDARDAVNAVRGLDGTRICGSRVKVEMEDARDANVAGRGLDGTRICGSRVKVEIKDATDVDDAGSGLDGIKILGSRVKIVSNGWKKRDWSRSRDSSGRQGRRRDRSRSKSMSRERKGRRDYGRVM